MLDWNQVIGEMPQTSTLRLAIIALAMSGQSSEEGLPMTMKERCLLEVWST